ncbi:hypothetical protein [Actinoplanes sp. NPDC051411]|uniref:hypothetical protein n=1 Tax=Actinoplanes sp. NPDC051411 TaxID=3155522 RepID=UPI00341F06FE
MSDALGRAYRRLLRFYPRGPRRDELLDTLLEAASPGRRRPTVRESVNLIRHGLRARMGYPRGRAVVVLVFLAGLVGAYFGGAAGSRLGWEFASPVPSAATAAEVTGTVFPGLKVWGGGDPAVIVPQSDGEGVEYGHATYWLRHTGATRDLTGYAAGARERLAAAGWQIHDYRYQAPEDMVDGGQDSSVTFWADRPGLVLGFEGDLYSGMPDYDNDGGSTLTLRRSEPAWLGLFSWPAALLGFALAWLVAAWASRRFSTFGIPGPLPGIVTGFMLFLFLPTMLLFPVPDTPGEAPWWAGLENGYGWLPLPLILGGLLVAGAAGPDIGRGLRFLGRHPRVATAGVALIAVGVVAATVLPHAFDKPLAAPPCHPAPGPPPERPGGEVRDSRSVHVYVDPASTPHQRALITAAMRRSWAGGDGDLVWDPGSAAFRDDYCRGATVPAASVATLPYFFTFELDVPADYPALLQEVQGMPGVVAVHRVPQQAG